MTTWSTRAAAAAIGIAIAIGGLGGAAVYAATNTGHRDMGTMHGGFPVGPPPIAQQSEALHGEYVVSAGGGGFTTVISQTGRVTAISPTSVSARSADGFVGTYVVGTYVIGTTVIGTTVIGTTVAVGDTVIIRATRVGGVATVDTIRPAQPTGR